MTIAEVKEEAPPSPTTAPVPSDIRVNRPPRDLQRSFELVLATVWLLDAALQLQPFMFTRGSNGFSGMLNGFGAGNPSWDRPHDHLERLERLPPSRS